MAAKAITVMAWHPLVYANAFVHDNNIFNFDGFLSRKPRWRHGAEQRLRPGRGFEQAVL